jgi:hypothetical protein
MGQDPFGAYGEAVDALVNLIEVFPQEQTRIGTESDELLLVVVDEYEARARGVFDGLIDRMPGPTLPLDPRDLSGRHSDSDEATSDRVLALVAGDFRLAASLIAVDKPWSTPAGADPDLAALRSALRDELADLRGDMQEIKAAVLDEPEGTDGGGGSSVPRPRPEPPSPTTPRVEFPPLTESSLTNPIAVGELAGLLGHSVAPTEASGWPVVSGGSDDGDPTELVKAEIDKILAKAAGQIGAVATGAFPIILEEFARVFAAFNGFVAGELGGWYEQWQAKLGGWVHRAKRAAVKLLHEGIEKLLYLLRRQLPHGSEGPIDGTLAELATGLAKFALRKRIRNELADLLKSDALKTHVGTTFGAMPRDADGMSAQASMRANRAVARANGYHKKKVPLDAGLIALRVARTFKLHHAAPPYSQIGMGAFMIGLCGISGWLAQDFLDHPPMWYVPSIYKGVGSAVDGQL